MNAKQVTLACCVFAATVAFGADWVYDLANNTVSDGVWTFSAQRSGTKVTLTGITGGPSEVAALDFSKPIKDTSDNAMYFGYFGRLMDNAAGQAFRPYVGELKLPASGYTGLGRNAFSRLTYATGTIALSPDLTGMEGGSAFNGSSGITIVGDSFPEGLTEISGQAFKGCKIQGDLVLTHVKILRGGAFANTDVGSVMLGPDLTLIENRPGGSTVGVFQGCSSLTNVVFDPESSVTNTWGLLFYQCRALEEVDLSAFVHIEQESDDMSLFRDCSSLKKVTFGSKLDYLDGRIFKYNSSISKIFFKGPPPATIANTYLLGVGNRRVTTYVVLDANATDYDYATAKAAWDALTAGGTINDTDSAWKSDLVGGVAAEYRPLVLYSVSHASVSATRDADEGAGVVGLFTVSRGEGDSTAADLVVNYTVDGTAVAGQTYGVLSGSVTIPAGETSATIDVVPLDDQETASNTTVVVTLSAGDYEIVDGHETATVNVIDGVFPGWKYTITGSNSGTVSRGDWSFAATHSGHDLTVGTVTAYPADVAPLDFSPIVVGSDGVAYTITRLGPGNDGLGLGGSIYAGSIPQPNEIGLRVGLLTLPGEGLTSICNLAFAVCTNAYGDLSFPSTLETIGDGAFEYTQVSGDLNFPSLKKMPSAVFWKTKINSVAFGPALEGVWGGWDRGPFYGCASLTNVVFDPASKITLGFQGFIFCHCTSLTDLDLSCVTNIAYENCGANFRGCSALTNITFGAGLTELPTEAFSGATALETLYFKGAAPVIVGDGGLFTGVGAAQTITTYVSVKFADVKNSANFSWNDYVEGGVLGKSSTYWKSEYLFSGAKTSNFPLLRFDSNALMIVVR